MRLWHEGLIPLLPRQQLLGQHRECCALRGRGWRKKHKTVNYIFNYNVGCLVLYHYKVMDEMERRGYVPDYKWINALYRGANCIPWDAKHVSLDKPPSKFIYREHDMQYLEECVENLTKKGVFI